MKRVARYQIGPDKHLSPSELLTLRGLLASPANAEGLALRLLLETGARVTELLQASVEDVLLDTNALAVYGIKGSLDRTIPLKPQTMALLKAHVEGRAKSEPLFKFKKRWLQQVWTTAYEPKLGTNKTLHALRHTFAIELLKVCRDIRMVQQALGHVNIENTMVYASYVYPTENLRAFTDLI